MASMKLGSKSDAFQRQGQAWFCTTGLPSDIVVEVGEMSFHLHKFPLLSRSGLMEKLISKASVEGDETCVIKIPEIPGGAKTFELVAKFCYGVKLELTASNVVYLRCTAQNLEMTEEYGENNLISVSENFLNQVVLKNWKDSLKALQTCDGLIEPEDCLITERCIESLAAKAVNESNLFGWPVREQSGPMQVVLWNGISTGVARANNHSSSDWWYEDVSTLSLNLYKKLVSSMESRGIKHEILAGSLVSYATRYLPGLKRRHSPSASGNLVTQVSSVNTLSENDQKLLLEDVEQLLPMPKGLVSTKFLFGLIRTAKILKASPSCITNLENRIGMQLDEASLDDLLLPNFSYFKETLYDVDCVQRILERFLATDQVTSGGASPPCSIDDDVDDDQRLGSSPSLMPVTKVAKLIDGYLAEVAPDINLKMPEFLSLGGAVPEYARRLDDGLYRAIDVYLKSHPWLVESERELLCRLLDCQKLSIEACTHAAQNERLPLRLIVQVLFFEQLQLRTSIAGCFLVSDNLDGSRNLRSGPNDGGWATTVRENQLLKVGMDSMRTRVSELEKECLSMKQEIEKLGRGKTSSDTWDSISKKLGFKMKSQMCSNGEEGSVKNLKIGNGKDGKAQDKIRKHKKKQHFQD